MAFGTVPLGSLIGGPGCSYRSVSRFITPASSTSRH